MRGFIIFKKLISQTLFLLFWVGVVYPQPGGPLHKIILGTEEINLSKTVWLSSEIGSVVGESGTLYETNDGGKTWTFVAIGDSNNTVVADLNSIAYQRSENGFTGKGTIVGDGGLILSSTDFGDTWHRVNSGTTANLNSVFYGYCETTKQSYGFIVGDNSTILANYYGDDNWYPQSTPYQSDNFYDVFFYNNDIGWIVGSTGIMYKTTNSGDRWNYVGVSQSNPDLHGVDFRSLSEGYVVGSNGKIFHTRNGGETWSEESLSPAEVLYYAVHAGREENDPGPGGSDTAATIVCPIAVGEDGFFVADSNKDGAWEKYELETSNNLNDISFDRLGYVWIVGDNGTMFTNRPQGEKPAAPSQLNSEAKSSTEIRLTFHDNSDNETGFLIERKKGQDEHWGTPDTFVVSSGLWAVKYFTENKNQYDEKTITPTNKSTLQQVEYTDAGLEPNTKYYYRVCAYNSAGNSPYSNETSATTFDVLPATPTNLILSVVSGSQINLRWSDNSNNELGFIIEKKVGNGSWSDADTTGANTTEYSDTGLQPNTEYYYRMSAYNLIGESPYSNEANARTSDPPPLAPTNLIAVASGSSRVNLSWSDNSSNETGFKIDRMVNQTSFVDIGTVNRNITSFADGGRIDGTKYTYRVAAVNSSGSSGYSNEAFAITQLNSPTELSAKLANNNSVQLDWKDNSQSETGITIQKKSNSGTYSKLTDLSANIITYTDSQVLLGNAYTYKLLAFNSFVSSDFSNEASILITDITLESDLPKEFSLAQNFPNPFNPSTVINFSIAKEGFVQLDIYSSLGEKVITLVNSFHRPGKYSVVFNASNISSGLYFYRINSGDFSRTLKMNFIK